MRDYAGRFLLPAVLLAAAIAAWFFAYRDTAVARAVATDEIVTNERPLLDADRIAAALANDPTPVQPLTEPTPESETPDIDIVGLTAELPPHPGGLSCSLLWVDGTPVVDVRSTIALVPSYAQLAVTLHAALDVLGPSFTFKTELLATGEIDDSGVLRGDLYVIGGGDPMLMSRGYASQLARFPEARTPLEAIAAAVSAAGVERIQGVVIAVDRRYDTERFLPGWSFELLTSGLVSPLTALQVDDALDTLTQDDEGVPDRESEQPTLHAIERIDELLGADGITALAPARRLADDDELPTELTSIGLVESAPLSAIVSEVLRTNDATAAELLLKELGFAVQNDGSTRAGGRVVQTIVRGLGIELPVAFRDGSGLDPIGGTTCTQLVELADRVPDSHPTIEALPRFHRPGVLAHPWQDAEVQADLRLVGGINGEAAGFVARSSGDSATVRVASIVNRPGGPTPEDLEYQQALLELADALVG